MQKFQEILTEAAQLKQTQLKNQRKNYESLPQYLKAGLNYCKKYQNVRYQHYMIQMNLSEKIKKKGNDLFKKEHYKEALACYEEALAVFRYIHTKSYDNMKDADLEYHNFELPQELNKFKEEYQTHLVALYLNICSCLTKTNKKEDAVHSADEALKIKQTAKAYYKKAQAYLQFINRQSSDIKVGFYFLNKCYQISKDPSVVAEMHKIKRQIDEERDKEKKWFKFMFDKNSQNQAPQQQKVPAIQATKENQSKLEPKISEQLRQQLQRGQRGEKEDQKLQKTKEKLSKFINSNLNDDQWLDAYEGEFIAKHGSKIYSIIQLFGLKEKLGEYRAILAQCLELKKEAEYSQRRQQVYKKYFQQLKNYPVDQVTKYLERYDLQTKWIKQQRSTKVQTQAKKNFPQSQNSTQNKRQQPPSITREKKDQNQISSKLETILQTETTGKQGMNKSQNLRFIEEVHSILEKSPKIQSTAAFAAQRKSLGRQNLVGSVTQGGDIDISQSQSKTNKIKYISFIVALLAILLIKFVS